MLIWLDKDHKIRPEDIDLFISAEIPSPTAEPVLYNLVKTHMIHGPCGQMNPKSPCIKDGVCSKSFPKQLIESTDYSHDGYPKYKRSSSTQEGNVVKITKNCHGNKVEFELDNQWVVPYNK